MYTINKVKSEFENEYNLVIDDAKVGTVEVIFLSDTSRTVNGSLTVYNPDGQEFTYEYYGEDTNQPMSINEFIKGAEEAIGDRELRLNPGDEYYDDGRQFDNVIVADDITEDNVDDMMDHLHFERPAGWDSQSPFQKVGYMHTLLREERDANMANPMRDLVMKSKMGHSRSTPMKFHYK